MKMKRKNTLPDMEDIHNEDEETTNLDVNELLEIEGGIDNDEDAGDCGLGCFLSGVY